VNLGFIKLHFDGLSVYLLNDTAPLNSKRGNLSQGFETENKLQIHNFYVRITLISFSLSVRMLKGLFVCSLYASRTAP